MTEEDKKFIKRANEYSCVYNNDTASKKIIYHYTNLDAVKGIMLDNCFYATDMEDFCKEKNGDPNEGHLILRQIMEWVEKENPICDQGISYVKELIGCEQKRDGFIQKHRTYVVSFCQEPDVKKMWKAYARNGCMLKINKEKFIKSLKIKVQSGEERRGIFYHAPIIYNDLEQAKKMKQECTDLNDLAGDGRKSGDLPYKEKVEIILKHLMYIGNFYKKESFSKEIEYRCLINTISTNIENDAELPKREFNQKTGKHFIRWWFDPKAVEKIVCATQVVYNKLPKTIICEYPVEIRSV